MIELVTKEMFLFEVEKLAERNSKVKQLIKSAGSYDNLPPNIKALIDKELGIVRKEVMLRRVNGDPT